MDRLKQFISDNREAFERMELSEGHELRFEQKLPHRRNPFRRYSLYALAAAASVALLIVFTLPFRGVERAAMERTVTCQTAAEIDNLRIYYNMQMNEIIAQMEAFNPEKNEVEKEQLLEESAKVMAASKYFEEAVIPQLPCAQETLYAMTQHYSTSLRSLNFMLRQMENNQETTH